MHDFFALVLSAVVLASGAVADSAATTAPAAAAAEPATRIQPAESTGVVTAQGSIRGHAYRDFVIRAGAGQTLAVGLKASSSSAYFNVLPPGSSDAAMFIGSTSGSQFQRALPIAGDYVVRVYLMRSAARRNTTSSFTLSASIAGIALVPTSSREDTKIQGSPFHATAKVKCALPYQPDVHNCEAAVIRYDHRGTATVELRGPNGMIRRILFVNGAPTVSDATEAPTFTRAGDSTTVVVGPEEHYEIPDALVTGG